MKMGPVVASAIEQRSLSALIPYAKTARTHSPTQVSQILATPSNRPPIDAKNAIPRPVFDVHLSTISAICRVSRRLARTPHRGARTPGRKAADDRWRQPAHRSPVESYHRALRAKTRDKVAAYAGVSGHRCSTRLPYGSRLPAISRGELQVAVRTLHPFKPHNLRGTPAHRGRRVQAVAGP